MPNPNISVYNLYLPSRVSLSRATMSGQPATLICVVMGHHTSGHSAFDILMLCSVSPSQWSTLTWATGPGSLQGRRETPYGDPRGGPASGTERWFGQSDMWTGKRWNLCKLLTWPRKGANTARVDRCQLQFTLTSWIQSSCIIFRTLVILFMALQRSSASFSTSVWMLFSAPPTWKGKWGSCPGSFFSGKGLWKSSVEPHDALPSTWTQPLVPFMTCASGSAGSTPHAPEVRAKVLQI